MKQVSKDWQNAIYAQTRETKATIHFPFVDPEAKASAQFNTLPQQSSISRARQMIDDNAVGIGKVAAFEPGYWKLDGSFILPTTTSQSSYGFRGLVLSDEKGEFSTDNVLRFYFTQPITVPGYTLHFDEATDEYLVDFDIISYNENMGVIRKVEVRGNDKALCVVELGSENIKYLDIVFRKTNHPQRSVRILEIDFGVLLIFESKNLFSVQLTSETDYLAESIPHNELVFTAQNDGKYDYTNPESYSKYLQERQEAKYFHKVKISEGVYEEVDMGTYLLHTWSVSDHQVEFIARSGFHQQLEDKIFSKNDLNIAATPDSLVSTILKDAGVTAGQITIGLQSNMPKMTQYFGENCTCLEALRQVLSACGWAVYTNASGRIIFRNIDFAFLSTDDSITYDNGFSAPSSKTTQYYNAIELTVYTPEGEGFSTSTEVHTAPWYQTGEPIHPYPLDLKMCIANSHWDALKPWILEQKFRVLGLRLSVDIEWRQNPAQDVGDIVKVQLDKSGGTAKVFMQKQVLTYKGGALRGNSVGIGYGNVSTQ